MRVFAKKIAEMFAIDVYKRQELAVLVDDSWLQLHTQVW